MESETKPNHREERMLDEATLLERPHLTAREERILQICAEMAVQDAMLRSDR